MAKPDRHDCPSRGVQVSIKQGFERCMIDHQCFSDDLCPLSGEFERQATLSVKVEKSLSKALRESGTNRVKVTPTSAMPAKM